MEEEGCQAVSKAIIIHGSWGWRCTVEKYAQKEKAEDSLDTLRNKGTGKAIKFSTN